MNFKDMIEYILPYIKITKRSGKFLLMNDIIIYINDESSQLYVIHLNIPTGWTICMDKSFYIDNKDIITENDNLVDYRYYYDIINKYQYYTSLRNMSYNVERLDEELDEYGYLKMKAKEGSKWYNIDDRYLLPFFYGVLPMTKLDTLDLAIFALDEISSVVRYSIYKKKMKSNIEIYMRIMNL